MIYKKGDTKNMYHFEYVSRNKRKPVKKELIEIINLVQDEVRKNFTFRFDFVGSDPLNLVTCDFSSNVGFDFDVNIRVNDDEENYSAEEIKHILSIIISSLDKIPNSGIPQNDIYNIYKQKENIVLILEKINENTELQTIIKDTPNLFEYYCYIINKIALFSDNPKCMNFIWNLK